MENLSNLLKCYNNNCTILQEWIFGRQVLTVDESTYLVWYVNGLIEQIKSLKEYQKEEKGMVKQILFAHDHFMGCVFSFIETNCHDEDQTWDEAYLEEEENDIKNLSAF